jgi:hypothetical protein
VALCSLTVDAGSMRSRNFCERVLGCIRSCSFACAVRPAKLSDNMMQYSAALQPTSSAFCSSRGVRCLSAEYSSSRVSACDSVIKGCGQSAPRRGAPTSYAAQSR